MASKKDVGELNVIDILGGRKTLGSEVRKEDDLIERIRQGLPYETVESVVAATAISLPLLPRLLGVTERTLQRRQTQKVLKKPG